jgi:hypothetical protein
MGHQVQDIGQVITGQAAHMLPVVEYMAYVIDNFGMGNVCFIAVSAVILAQVFFMDVQNGFLLTGGGMGLNPHDGAPFRSPANTTFDYEGLAVAKQLATLRYTA